MGGGGYVKEQEGTGRWLKRRSRTKENFPIVERKFENKFAQQNRKAFSDDSEEEAERKKISPLSLFYDLRDGGGRLKKWPEVKVTIPADIFSQRLLCCKVRLRQNWPKSQAPSVNRIISKENAAAPESFCVGHSAGEVPLIFNFPRFFG